MRKKRYNFFMTIIRKLRYWDKKNVKKMISFLGNDEAEMFVNKLLSTSCSIFHYFLPLKLKFLSESYVVVDDDKDLHGMISVVPVRGNAYRINIVKLLFKKDYYNIGKQLIEFIIAKYGAIGAQSFIVGIDESYDELQKLFIDGCGFRKCASEELWRVDRNKLIEKTAIKNIRRFKNSDAKSVAALYNSSLITHFKPSLLKCKDEYKDYFFVGLFDNVEFKYVIEDSISCKIIGFFSIKTFDNMNYIIDIVTANGFEFDYDTILGYAKAQIQKRQNSFAMFVKLKRYAQQFDIFEKYLTNHDFKCVKNQVILFKNFYKLIKQDVINNEIVLLSETNINPLCEKSEL